MNKKRHFLMRSALALFMTFFSLWSWGQYSITGIGIGNAYTQNFDTFRGTVATIPASWALSGTANSTTAYQILTAGGTTPTPSTANGNNFYAGRASSSSSDYSVLQKQGTSGSSTFTFSAKNNTSSTINGFVINWNIEQFAVGGRATTVDFKYRLNGGTYVQTGITGTTLYTASTGTTASTFAFVNSTPTGYSITVTGISLAVAETVDFQFSVTNGTGSGSNAWVGIDDFTFYATAPTSTDPNLTITPTTLNHGSSCVSTPASFVEYLITNSGTLPAENISVISSGTNASDFTVTGPVSTTIAPGDTTKFTVTFTPSAAGIRNATITVASSTAGSNSPTLALTGTGTATIAGVVTTVAESNVGSTAVRLNGSVTTLGTCPATTEKGFVWGLNADPTIITDQNTSVTGVSTGAYFYELTTGLAPNTTYHYRAYIKDANNAYTYGADETFTTSAVADHLAFVNVPAGGYVNTTLSTFTVEARTILDAVDAGLTGNVTISKASGTGAISGTVTKPFVNGIATFDDIKFDAAGTYSLHADHGTFAQITSGNINIVVVPPFSMIEEFSYTAATNLNGQGGWTSHSGTANQIKVTASSISYPGYLSSGIGNEITLSSANSEDLNKAFTTQTSGTIYASALVNVSSATTGGDYFFHLGPNPILSAFRGRVFVKSVSGGIQFGVANAGGTPEYGSTVYDLNKTYLLVLKYDINSTAADAAKIYVNPELNAAEPATGWVLSDDLSQQPTIGSVALRQGTSSTAPNLFLDGIRVSNNWADIVGPIIPTTTWNGSAWSDGTPTNSVNAVIAGDYSNAGFTARNVTVNSGASLTVKNAETVTANNVTLQDGANLIQQDGSTLTVNGTFTVNRNTVSAVNKYAFWSSPVANQNMYNIFGVNNKPAYVMTYNTATNFYDTVADPAVAVSGKGYSIKTPLPSPAVSFVGTPHNGLQTIAMSTATDKYNLVGNPYPSNLDLSAFLSVNSANIGSTLWFWDNTGGTVTTQTGNTASNFGYATFNAAGDGTWVKAPNGTGTVPSGNLIKTGQAFIVEAVGTELTFNNSMRAANSGVNFNKGTAQNAGTGKYWLTLSTSYNAKVSQAITYQAGASNEYDVFDSKAIGLGADAFYSIAGTEKVIIQGKAAFQTDDVVTLGNRHFESGTFTIALTQKEGLFADGQAVYLKDKLTGTQTNLQNGAYTFTSDAGDFGDRFEITYKQGVLGTDNSIKSSVTVFRSGDDFVIESPSRLVAVEVYDVSGRLISSRASKANREVITVLGKGVYILQIKNQAGVVSKKIVK